MEKVHKAFKLESVCAIRTEKSSKTHMKDKKTAQAGGFSALENKQNNVLLIIDKGSKGRLY